jgi:hypothetical protein
MLCPGTSALGIYRHRGSAFGSGDLPKISRINRIPAKRWSLEHDPEKWTPVFGRDHAPPKDWSAVTTPREVIPLYHAFAS